MVDMWSFVITLKIDIDLREKSELKLKMISKVIYVICKFFFIDNLIVDKMIKVAYIWQVVCFNTII